MPAILPYCRSPLLRLMKRGMLKWVPGMITCVEFEHFVVDYLDNTLPDPKLKVFERHLKICPECVDYIEHYKQTLELAARCMEDAAFDNAGNPPEDLVSAILAAQQQGNS